jgi:tyrosyl-tRNA synthetase
MEEIGRIRESQVPLDAKKQLAKRIVADFHSAEEAERVASTWGGLPPLETLDRSEVTDSRLNRALAQARLVSSVTEADKIIKANGVSIFTVPAGEEVNVTGPAQKLAAGDYVVRVGKKYKHLFLPLNAPQ